MFKPVSKNAVTHKVKSAEYHKLGADRKPGDPLKIMSRSELFKFGECPSRWFHGIEDTTTDAMRFGSVVDCLVVNRADFDEHFVVSPETYPCTPTKADGRTEKPWNYQATYCKEWRTDQEARGLECITHPMMKQAQTAVMRLDAHHKIPGILNVCARSVQILVEWHDEETGLVVPIKCLLDLLPDPKSGVGDTIYDFKTTNDASSRRWTRRVYDDGLHYQAAIYLDAANAATGAKYKQFGHIIQESYAPYEPTVRVLSSEFLSFGRGHYMGDLKHYCRCLANNRWPGLDEAPVEPEPWMAKEL